MSGFDFWKPSGADLLDLEPLEPLEPLKSDANGKNDANGGYAKEPVEAAVCTQEPSDNKKSGNDIQNSGEQKSNSSESCESNSKAALNGTVKVGLPSSAKGPLKVKWVRNTAQTKSRKEFELLDLEHEATKPRLGMPVPLASLGSYLSSLQPEDASLESQEATLHWELPVSPHALAPGWAAAQLSRACGAAAVPFEFWAAALGSDNFDSGSLRAATESATMTMTVGDNVLFSRPSPSACKQPGWQVLHDAVLLPNDPIVCGKVGPVPELPNPFSLTADLSAVLESMLSEIDKGSWDSISRDAVLPPYAVAEFPGLYRGLGGVLPTYTPRQLAMNAIAASVLNRLCANLMSAVADVGDAAVSASEPSPMELAIIKARQTLKEAMREEELARAEETDAVLDLRKFERERGTDMERHQQLQHIVGWKSSVTEQMQREVGEAKKALSAAEDAWKKCGQQEQPPWHKVWGCPVPKKAASKPFAVRLTQKSKDLWTIHEFCEALEDGIRETGPGAGWVQKHQLEGAFVFHSVDGLLLCTRAAGNINDDEAAASYTHLPIGPFIGTGLADHQGNELKTIRPEHGFVLRASGQTFPFNVELSTFGGNKLAFAGLECHPLSCPTPWNQLQYTDVLWANECQECLDLLPAIVALGCIVDDTGLPLGPLPPAPKVGSYCAGSLALLQAALFNDTKMWPVFFPDAIRLRWAYILRCLRYLLGRSVADDTEDGPIKEQADLLRNEVIPKLESALRKVPDDGEMSGGSCDTFIDRLKRMELSVLVHSPFTAVKNFEKAVKEITEMMDPFMSDTGG